MILTIPYAAQWYYQDIDAAREALYPPIKPFIYRVLLPWLGRMLLAVSDLRLDLIVIALMVISGVTFMFSLQYLYATFYPFTQWTELQLIAMYGGFVALFSRYPKIYDLAAAALFTFCLASLARRRYRDYLLVFAIATLNRETIALLVPFFLPALLIYLLIQFPLRMLYADAPGQSFYFNLAGNLWTHLQQPLSTIIVLLCLCILFYFVFRQWQRKPYFIRLTFITLAPVFVVMYLAVGQAFEYRVFGEVYSVVALLVMKGMFL